ncbi:YopX family protein [Lysinibacillus irui]|uniref:YopX family protein n=1 Tax=Lysinibacillus irui TaxID=2998077 RepID=UPI002AD50E25|nr:YopX family protein [Lysinibacillus irui]MEA0564564.1 YopX family protein [Lysinibacillus irui]
MREIKFRGKCLRTNDWVYGLLIIKRNEYYIGYISNISGIWSVIQVEPKTVGQYTGLKDKEDKEIYEGDLVLLKNEFASWKGTVVFDEGAFKLSIKHSWGTSVEHFNKTNVFNDMGARIQLNNIYLVVGNIYENPELLGDSQ